MERFLRDCRLPSLYLTDKGKPCDSQSINHILATWIVPKAGVALLVC